jgi:protein involved in polysaccharide export with SLBB domain
MKQTGQFLLVSAAIGALLCAALPLSSAAADDATVESALSQAVQTAATPVGPDYRLSPRDLVQFEVFEEPETLVVQRVSTSGAIVVPMLGLIQVADQTLLEVERSAEKAYIDKGFYVHPQVMVTVQAYAPRSVSVLGQVNHPEQIALPIEASRIGIMKAITLAEGFTRLAKSDEVLVIRTVDDHEEQHTININKYLTSGGSEPEFELRPDDIVFVPERVF